MMVSEFNGVIEGGGATSFGTRRRGCSRWAWALALAAPILTSACGSKPPDDLGPDRSSLIPPGWPNPKEACAYLEGRGYQNRGYKAYSPSWPDDLTCQSLNRKVGGGTAVVGQAGFYYSVVGVAGRADYMRLRADVVRGGADEQAALDEFAATTAELSQRAFHAPLPAEAQAALKAGTAGKWPLEGNHELTLERRKEPGGPFGQVYNLIAELHDAPKIASP